MSAIWAPALTRAAQRATDIGDTSLSVVGRSAMLTWSLVRLTAALTAGHWWVVSYLLSQLLVSGYHISQSARLATTLRRVVRELALRLPGSMGGAPERALRLRALSARGVVCSRWLGPMGPVAGEGPVAVGAAAVARAAWACEAAHEMGPTPIEGRELRFGALLDAALTDDVGARARARAWAGVGAAAIAPFVLGAGAATGAIFEHPERRLILAVRRPVDARGLHPLFVTLELDLPADGLLGGAWDLSLNPALTPALRRLRELEAHRQAVPFVTWPVAVHRVGKEAATRMVRGATQMGATGLSVAEVTTEAIWLVARPTLADLTLEHAIEGCVVGAVSRRILGRHRGHGSSSVHSLHGLHGALRPRDLLSVLMQVAYAVCAMQRLGVACPCQPGQVRLVDLGANASFHFVVDGDTSATPASRWMARVAAEPAEPAESVEPAISAGVPQRFHAGQLSRALLRVAATDNPRAPLAQLEGLYVDVQRALRSAVDTALLGGGVEVLTLLRRLATLDWATNDAENPVVVMLHMPDARLA
jgi:hypothetical protein